MSLDNNFCTTNANNKRLRATCPKVRQYKKKAKESELNES